MADSSSAAILVLYMLSLFNFPYSLNREVLKYPWAARRIVSIAKCGRAEISLELARARESIHYV